MRQMGVTGVTRGKPVRTTISARASPCPLAAAAVPTRNRESRPTGSTASSTRPARMPCGSPISHPLRRGKALSTWLSSSTPSPAGSWAGGSDACVARTAHAGFGLDALEQALHDRRPAKGSGLVHHSDRGVHYVSIKDTERLTEAGVEPSVGRVGDSDDNALAETLNGLDKAEVIRRRGPWRNLEAVEFATLEGVDGFNNRRLLEPIGGIPPAEAEARSYAQFEEPARAA